MIAGVMWDATGKNLTRAQVSSRSTPVSRATVATENSVVHASAIRAGSWLKRDSAASVL
jgi:hypothetical protein